VAEPLNFSAREVFQEPSFLRFWWSRGCSTLCYQMFSVAVGWQMYEFTHSTFALGMVGLVQFLPLLVLMLLVGHVADRVSRRTIVAVCQTIEAATAFVLAVASYTHHLHPTSLFVGVAVLGAARAFELPSIQALAPTLVAEELVPQALAWSSSANQTATILGPALGGFLYIAGAHVPYFTCTILFLCASGFSSAIRSMRPPANRKSSLFSGIHYIRDHKNILGAISLDLFAVLLGGATALLPVYAHDILHTGPWGLGLLRLAPAIGALSTSVLLAHYPIRNHAGMRMFTAVIVFGLATIGFALSHSLWFSMPLLVVLGCADVTSVVVRSSLVQLETPNEMRGRVSAVNVLFVGTSNQLGEFESGLTASWLGLVPATIVGGVGSIVVALLWMRLFPSLRTLDRLSQVRSTDST
jgi:MFS family permease